MAVDPEEVYLPPQVVCRTAQTTYPDIEDKQVHFPSSFATTLLRGYSNERVINGVVVFSFFRCGSKIDGPNGAGKKKWRPPGSASRSIIIRQA